MATGDPGHNPHAFTAHEKVQGIPRKRKPHPMKGVKKNTAHGFYWQVRMYNPTIEELCNRHPGWFVIIRDPINPERDWKDAIDKVKALGIDNGPDGEFSQWPEFTADVLEINEDIAELH